MVFRVEMLFAKEVKLHVKLIRATSLNITFLLNTIQYIIGIYHSCDLLSLCTMTKLKQIFLLQMI